MRSAALCDRHAKAFEEVESQANKSFFSEIIASISDITFSADGRYILSRDYMTMKLWDINRENAPVATFNVHEHLRARVSVLLSFQALPSSRISPYLILVSLCSSVTSTRTIPSLTSLTAA